jgi:allophanate hydrolase subunit 2
LRVVDGPDRPARAGLFQIDEAANRMGVRLTPSENDDQGVGEFAERPSAPIAPGAVQATPAGPIALGVACGTMGGYPHVAHVISADLDMVGQLRPGDIVELRPVSMREARHFDSQHRIELSGVAIRFKTLMDSLICKSTARRASLLKPPNIPGATAHDHRAAAVVERL